MHPFDFVRASDSKAAIRQVGAQPQACFVAGGSNLIDFMKLQVLTPTLLVDVNQAPLTDIEVTDSRTRIGAMVRNSDLAYHAEIQRRYPVLSEALLSGATAQIRNVATVGGNLMQRTRCMFFRDTIWPCNKREPGAGCSALDGYNRQHAILGTSEKCIATHPSDMCVAMVALGATVLTQGPEGERRIPITDFHVAYGEDPTRDTVLKHGEMITGVELPVQPFFARSHYLKIRDRSSFEFALVSVAAAIEVRDGRITETRLALGGVATKPWRGFRGEKVLVGQPPEERTFQEAAKAILQEAEPRKHNGFKVELTRRAIVRALTTVAKMD